jgi:tetratricopeptide (TPR) repeat protein
VDLDPAERWGRFFLGLALATRGEGATAATELEALARGVPGAPVFALEGASALQQAGQAVTAQGLLDRYRDFYQPALGSGLPGDDLYWLARGEVLEGAGRGEEALQAYDAALAARGGQRSRAVYAKAALLRARRDLAGAQRLLEDITPEDGSGALPEAYLALGELRFGARDYAQGSQAFALGLARLQQAQAPPARRSQLYLEVKRRLEAAGQAELARLWEDEARGFTR